MIGAGQVIPTKDETEIGLPARRYIREQACRFVMLVDDVERARQPELAAVFTRYRRALDTLLTADERERAAVHFFKNMLEAYYFANSEAVNAALETTVLGTDYGGDVEDISHPKNQLKTLHRGFDECADGATIVARLDLDHILSTPNTCACLRSLFGWCVEKLTTSCLVYDANLHLRYGLPDGQRAEPMRSQRVHD